MKNRRVIITMPTEEEFMPSISRWGHEFNWTRCEAHFVHVVEKTYEVSEMSIREFPSSDDLKTIKNSNLEFFKKKAREIMPEKAFENAKFEVFFDTSPAEKIAEYAKSIDANMVVVATRNKRGLAKLFTSSFADRILTLSPCDILILRPNKE